MACALSCVLLQGCVDSSKAVPLLVGQVAGLKPVPGALMEPPSKDYDDCLLRASGGDQATPEGNGTAPAGGKPLVLQGKPKYLSNSELRFAYLCQASNRKLLAERLIMLQDSVQVRQRALADLQRYMAHHKQASQ